MMTLYKAAHLNDEAKSFAKLWLRCHDFPPAALRPNLWARKFQHSGGTNVLIYRAAVRASDQSIPHHPPSQWDPIRKVPGILKCVCFFKCATVALKLGHCNLVL